MHTLTQYRKIGNFVRICLCIEMRKFIYDVINAVAASVYEIVNVFFELDLFGFRSDHFMKIFEFNQHSMHTVIN